VNIGDALAEGRRQAGLTVTQVSQRTCIRETIIRGIERGDFSSCGGDFYARGHIRSIANAVGMNPEPLIEQYDATMGAPKAISAADVFQPVTPVKLKERRHQNWTAALALALILVLGGFFAYRHFADASAAPTANQDAKVQTGGSSSKPKISTSPASHTHATAPKQLAIKLTATQDSWVQLRSTHSGATIFSGMVYRGTSLTWTEHHPVTMSIGNPAGVKLLVNGRNPVPPGSVASVTVYLHATKA
jgi:cytoskeletal protein RodZ